MYYHNKMFALEDAVKLDKNKELVIDFYVDGCCNAHFNINGFKYYFHEFLTKINGKRYNYTGTINIKPKYNREGHCFGQVIIK